MMLRRTTPFTKREREAGEFASFHVEPPAARMAANLNAEQPTTIDKDDTFSSEAWRRAVASLPCVLCGKEGETQCAHRNEGKGMAMKTPDVWSAGLCVACHSAIDQGNALDREERRERMDLAIFLTWLQLAVRGLVRVTTKAFT